MAVQRSPFITIFYDTVIYLFALPCGGTAGRPTGQVTHFLVTMVGFTQSVLLLMSSRLRPFISPAVMWPGRPLHADDAGDRPAGLLLHAGGADQAAFADAALHIATTYHPCRHRKGVSSFLACWTAAAAWSGPLPNTPADTRPNRRRRPAASADNLFSCVQLTPVRITVACQQ